MKFIGYTSVICLSAFCVVHDANAVNMTSQIQRLINEKQEKISKLEECDGKRKGFMIAGISTIGLTAVGIGVNIAQASKSNKLSNQIADQNRQLEKQQTTLADINSQISQKQEDKSRAECEQLGRIWENGMCKDKPIAIPQDATPTATDNTAIVRCIEEIEHTVVFGFDAGKMALYTPDGYLIPGDKALQISRNWNYSNFTTNISAMRSTISYNSANGVQEHEKDACDVLNRLKNYLATVDKSTLKRVENLGVAEYINLAQNNNAGGEVNTPTDRPTYYRNMDDVTMALDTECRNSGGTGRNAGGDCQCPNGMNQSENKRHCVCLDPTATYNKQQDRCVPGTINISPIAATPISGLSSQSSQSAGTVTTPQQTSNTENRDGYANTLLAESILEQNCSSVEKDAAPLLFKYHCVGTTQRNCEKLKRAFEEVGLPAPDVEFKAKIEEQLWPSGTRSIKNVCVVYL